MEPVSYGHRILTSFFANPSRLQCCADNRTESFRPAGIGYWSYQDAIDGEPIYTYEKPRGGTHGPNITIKWIHGYPHPKFYYTSEMSLPADSNLGHLVWRDIPKLTALNGRPIIESASAEVTVDRADGKVQSFQILDEPTVIRRPAWNDSFVDLGYVDPTPGMVVTAGWPDNIATSYGFLFLDAMMLAADLTTLGGVDVIGYNDYEPVIDRTFNFRSPGLNMDFMTYSMYSLAGNHVEALLDPDVQASTANKVFGTFFQHFISSNVTGQGSWAYQPVKESTSVEATVARRVEMLQMSTAATAICLTILAFFIVITIVVYFVDYKHFADLQHDVDSMADVLRLVCDSPKFLAWLSRAQRNGPNRMARQSNRRNFSWFSKAKRTEKERFGGQDEPKVKLDLFMGSDGRRKWVVEMVDPEPPTPGRLEEQE